MDVNITTVHFSISEDLENFTQKKIAKAIAKHDDVVSANVTMKLTKPETINNKEAEIRVNVPGAELFAKKAADTFEEAVDVSLEAIKRQLQRRKEKLKP